MATAAIFFLLPNVPNVQNVYILLVILVIKKVLTSTQWYFFREIDF